MLSRQIRAREDELKVQLFVRDKRATELTSGWKTVAGGREAVARLGRSRAATGRAGGARSRIFTIGFGRVARRDRRPGADRGHRPEPGLSGWT
ncbi:hypothetical protein [Kribbella qitaiheensis]|uniref:hypothetical protein n=1 Tax=Kribbella qitaiheensis TaxID=1544730 RepID=UPI0019D68F12